MSDNGLDAIRGIYNDRPRPCEQCAEKDKEIERLEEEELKLLKETFSLTAASLDDTKDREIKRLEEELQATRNQVKACEDYSNTEVKRLEGIIFHIVDTWVMPDDYFYEDRIKKSKEYCLKNYGIEIPTDEDK